MYQFNNKVSLFYTDQATINFWKNSNKIEKFANSILNYFEVENKKIIIDLRHNHFAQTITSMNDGNNYSLKFYKIELPLINNFLLTEEEKIKLIFARSIYLRHEIAHVLFSDFTWIGNISRNYKDFINIIEDIRVEHFYCERLKGFKKSFFQFYFLNYKRLKEEIENNKISLDNLGKYICFKMNNINEWKQNYNIKVYEYYFNKFKPFIFDKNITTYQTGINNLIEELKLYENNLAAAYYPYEEDEDDDYGDNIISSTDRTSDQNLIDVEKTFEDQPHKREDILKEYQDTFGLNEQDEEFEELNELFDDTEININPTKFLFDINSKVKRKTNEEIKDLKFSYEDVNDALCINMKNFFSYFKGLSLFKKEGASFYKHVINENKKVINESVRFLNLKLQNKTRIKDRRFLEEGGLDQDNVQEVLINKESPKAFLKQIKILKPRSTVHILIDISTSMNSTQIKLCFINAIILFEICKRMNMKYTMQMFTSLSSKLFHTKTRKNGISLFEIKKVFKNYEKSAIIYFDGVSGATPLNLVLKDAKYKDKKVKSVMLTNALNKAIVYYLKEVNDPLTKEYEKILGNLYKSASKVRSFLGQGTPEIESFCQVFKLHKNDDNKNKIFFLINDGQYDKSSFYQFFEIDQREANNSYLNGGYNIHMDDNIRKKHIEKVKEFENSIRENRMIYLNYLNKDQKNDEELTLQDFNSVFEKIYSKLNNNNNLYNFSDKEDIIYSLLDNIFSSQDDYSLEIYRKIINNLRSKNWKIIGAGINSFLGQRYIGYDYFSVFKTAEDIKLNFAKRLRDNF